MAKHDVTFELPPRELGRSDVKFQVKRDGKMLGTVTVSNGSVVWFPKGVSNGYKATWREFDTLMQKAKRVERRQTP